VDLTPSDRVIADGHPPGEDLPVDPDVTREERVPSLSPRAVPGAPMRRRTEPGVLWARLARAVVRRRDVLAVIAAGGALGSLARWGLAEALPHPPDAFPSATFVANVSGCFLIGLLMVFVVEIWPPSRYVRPFLGVGILGGYTTFSTYMLDARTLLVNGEPQLAGAYLFGSMAAGFCAVWLAILVARSLVRSSRRRRRARLQRDPAAAPDRWSRRLG
jgi:CrcB protein